MSAVDKRVQIAIYQKEKEGNSCCGDSYFYLETDKKFYCAIADGLGSGKFAQESAQVVIGVIKNNIHLSETQLIKKCSEELLGMRGVVLGLLVIDYDSQSFRFLSVGNIGLMTIIDSCKKNRNIPNRGYLAGSQHKFKVTHEKLTSNMVFLMFSDGVTDKELSQNFLLYSDVKQLIEFFSYMNNEPRADDTTLIAMNYTK